jgi:hypothetical protein
VIVVPRRQRGTSTRGPHNKKDVLENKLHTLVCGRKISLATAQYAIVTDWRTAYVKYVGKP